MVREPLAGWAKVGILLGVMLEEECRLERRPGPAPQFPLVQARIGDTGREPSLGIDVAHETEPLARSALGQFMEKHRLALEGILGGIGEELLFSGLLPNS